MLILKHKGTKEIKCDKCGVTATCGLKTVGDGIAKVRCWDIPRAWKVTLPKGWLCPKCPIESKGEIERWILENRGMGILGLLYQIPNS